MIPLRRLALALLLALALVAGASALDGYTYSQTVEYAACDQAVYQQDLVIHRSAGTAYEETVGGLNIWHLYVGTDCQADYGDLRFTDATGTELSYYLWPDYTSSSARFAVRLEGATAPGTVTVAPTPAPTPRTLGTVYAVNYKTSPPYGSAPFMVRFTAVNETDVEYTHWNFGDGHSSTERDHWHTYDSTGTYTVTLTVGNATWNQTAEILIEVEPLGVVPLPTDEEMMV